MQRLSPRADDGAVAVLVAVLGAAIFSMMALVIDIGAMYLERRELQNGADAAALAVAIECAKGRIAPPCQADISGLSVAQPYANDNAGDGAANVSSPAFAPDPPRRTAGKVTVSTSTLERNGGTLLPPFFARLAIPGYEGDTFGATAVAEWGGPVREDASPLGISRCEFERATTDGYEEMPVTGEGTPIHVVPGLSGPCGFGWLDAPRCDRDTLDLQVGESVTVSPVPQEPDCQDLLDDLVDKGEPVAIPIYDTGTRVVGFAAFLLTGYRLHDRSPPWQSNPPRCQPGVGGSCLQGHFVFVMKEDGELESPSCPEPSQRCPSMGVAIIRLTDDRLTD